MGALNFDPTAVLAEIEKRTAEAAKPANAAKADVEFSSLSNISSPPPAKNEPNDTPAGVPQNGAATNWAASLARLRSTKPPEAVTAENWRQLIHDGECFLKRWG